MSDATIDYARDDAHEAGVAGLAMGTVGGSTVLWEILFHLVPAIDPERVHLDPVTAKIVYAAFYLVTGFAFFWFVVRRVRDAVGIGPFTRFVTFWYGLFGAGYAIFELWQLRFQAGFPWGPFPWSAAAPFVCVMITVMGHPPAVAKRLFAGRACIVGVAVSWCLFMGLQWKLALDVAGISVAAGLFWIALGTDFRVLFRRAGGQAAMEWSYARGDIVKYALMIAAGFVLFFGSGSLSKAHPGLMKDWQFVLVTFLSLGLILRAIYKLFGVAHRLLRSLIPSFRPGLDMVAGQKVHGAADYAGPGSVDAALRDQDLGGRQPVFRD